MVEVVIALLMWIGVDLKEHVPYDSIGDCLKAKRLECKPVKAKTEIWEEDGKKHILKIVE